MLYPPEKEENGDNRDKQREQRQHSKKHRDRDIRNSYKAYLPIIREEFLKGI